ncbi:hypothetical protein V6Z11_D11G289300 [Gossypium hirsutum]
MSKKLEGISPYSLFIDKSRDSSNSNLPMMSDIFPIKRFLDKFNDRSPMRFPISLGISPVRLLTERSMLVTSPNVVLYSSSRPFSTNNALK